MNGQPRLQVASGLHSGASIALRSEQEVRIGCAADADLILVDEGITAHHATVRLDGDGLVLHAESDDVTAFGRVLKAGRHTRLRHGAIFALGDTVLLFGGHEPIAEADLQHAELAWLRAHAPLAWLRQRCARMPRYGWYAIAVPALVLALSYGLNRSAVRTSAPQSPVLERPAFRHVQVRADKATGSRIYEGYVQTPADLGALSLAVRAIDGAVSVRVAVIDNMQEQLSDFLDKYYRGASVRALDPGAFVATPPAADAYLQPDSWDYARVGRLAREQVDGLNALTFTGHEHDSGPVRMPLEALGLNLLSTPHAAWLADQKGTRYFAGARIAIGRIERIRACGATIVRDDGSVYELAAQRTGAGKPC